MEKKQREMKELNGVFSLLNIGLTLEVNAMQHILEEHLCRLEVLSESFALNNIESQIVEIKEVLEQIERGEKTAIVSHQTLTDVVSSYIFNRYADDWSTVIDRIAADPDPDDDDDY